jgi:2-desacetyl-2-hydroxyethyl bacteriochlorophyllide A dehydrogenase
MNTMTAAVLDGVRNLNVRQVAIPSIADGEALVQVKACGICQTDYKAFTGERMNWLPPIVLGHEISGIIADIKNQQSPFKAGDEVIVSPMVSCGFCSACRTGMQHYCTGNRIVIGGDGAETVWDGGFAEFVRVPETALYFKSRSTTFAEAALTEPLAGSYKGLIENTKMVIGEDVVIIGAGGMGLLLAQIASAAGAGTLIVIDLDDEKLQYAQRCGASNIINAQTENVKDAVYRMIPAGPDIVFEAAGPIKAAELAYQLCRRGTRLNMFGVTTPGTIEVSPADIHFNEIKVDASFSVNSKAMLKAINLMDKKLVDPKKIITHTFRLQDIHEAFATMSQPDRIKIMIEP